MSPATLVGWPADRANPFPSRRVKAVRAHLALLFLGSLPSVAFAQALGDGAGGPDALLFGAGALAVVVVFVGLARLRHVRARRKIARRFDDFKEHVIGLREQVESLTRRHEGVPSLPDFREPMAGTTKALYGQLQEEFGRLLDAWRTRMDLWGKIQALVESQGALGAGRFKEAGRLLEGVGAFGAVDAACQSCTTQLDRLEHGHEEASRRQQAVEDQANALRPRLDVVRALDLPTEPYEEELRRGTALAGQAGTLRAADPVGACDALAAAEEKLKALGELLAEVERLHRRRGEAREEMDRVAREAAARRAGGLLLREPGGDPDPPLAEGEARRADALDALRRGDVKAAADQLEQAFALTKQALDAIEGQASSRTNCLRDLPARRAAVGQLAQSEAEARANLVELEQTFAPESWRAVANCPARGRELMDTSAALLDEAAAAAAEDVQHYFRAADLLAQAQRQQKQALDLFQSVGLSLQRLGDLRRESLRRAEEIAAQARRVEEFFAAHGQVVRPAARGKLDAARERWHRASAAARDSRPDWVAVRLSLDEAGRGLGDVELLAREDVRLADRAAQAIAEAEQEADRLRVDPTAAGLANLSGAGHMIGRARDSLAVRDYERAADEANAARGEARRAHEDALRRLREEEESRRRQATAAAAATAMAATDWSPANATPAGPAAGSAGPAVGASAAPWPSSAETPTPLESPAADPVPSEPPAPEPPSEPKEATW